MVWRSSLGKARSHSKTGAELFIANGVYQIWNTLDSCRNQQDAGATVFRAGSSYGRGRVYSLA